MAPVGCKIYAYDHTISAPAKRGNNIKFFKTGLGKGENLKTLSTMLLENGHSERKIEYLKAILKNFGTMKELIKTPKYFCRLILKVGSLQKGAFQIG